MQGKKSQNKETNKIKKVINMFLKTDVKAAKHGCYVIDGDDLVYRKPITREFHLKPSEIDDFCKNVRAGNIVLISPTLEHINNKKNEQVNNALWNGPIVKVKYLAENKIAKRINQGGKILYVANSDMLDLIGRKVSFGCVYENTKTTEIQKKLALLVPMLDFSEFFSTSEEVNLRYQCAGWKLINEQKPGIVECDDKEVA